MKKKKVNKQIASEFAIGFILLLAITTGGIIWLQSEDQIFEIKQMSQELPNRNNNKKSEKKSVVVSKTEDCPDHYYEGETQIKVWSTEKSVEDGITVNIKADEAQKLPIKEQDVSANLSLKLIDPTEEIKNDLATSSEENPINITIRGFAETCQPTPLVSVKAATVAFKKS